MVWRARRVRLLHSPSRRATRVRRELPLKEELSYTVSPLIGRSRSPQLVRGERPKGYSRGGAGEKIRRELLQGIRRSKGR